MASCAVCMRAIVRGQPFLLHGTEVVHRACLNGLATTLRVKLEADLRRARQEVLEQAHVQLEYTQTIERLTATITDLQRQLREKNTEYHQLQGFLDGWKSRATRAEARLARGLPTEGALADQLRRELAAARDEVERLRRQAAAQPQPTTPAPADPAPTNTATDLDDSALRFSLLDLDLPK